MKFETVVRFNATERARITDIFRHSYVLFAGGGGPILSGQEVTRDSLQKLVEKVTSRRNPPGADDLWKIKQILSALVVAFKDDREAWVARGEVAGDMPGMFTTILSMRFYQHEQAQQILRDLIEPAHAWCFTMDRLSRVHTPTPATQDEET